MKYFAKDIAKFIISYCSSLFHPISNLKLQKILYFVWIDYYKETLCELYSDEICAWQLGPVVPEVYYEYCSYGGRPIDENYKTEIADEDVVILQKIIDKYVYLSTSSLVNITHQPGKPWDLVYKNGMGNRHPIPFELIKSLECGS